MPSPRFELRTLARYSGFSENLSFIGGANEILCIFATFSYELNNIKRRLLFFKTLLNDFELRVNGWCDICTVLRVVPSTSVLTIRTALEDLISFGNVNYTHGRTTKLCDNFKFKNGSVECEYCVADNASKSFVIRQLFQSIRYFSEEGVDGEEL